MFSEAIYICFKLPALIGVTALVILLDGVSDRFKIIEDWSVLDVLLGFAAWFILALLTYNVYCLALSASFPSLESIVDRFKRFILPFTVIYWLTSILGSVPQAVFIRSIDPINLVRLVEDSASTALFAVSTLSINQMIVFLILSLIGTWIPARLLNDRTKLSIIFRRGCHHFFWTFSRLIVGPGLIGIIFGTAFSVVFFVHGMEKYHLNNIISINYIRIGLVLLWPFIEVYLTVLIAVIISRTYLKSHY